MGVSRPDLRIGLLDHDVLWRLSGLWLHEVDVPGCSPWEGLWAYRSGRLTGRIGPSDVHIYVLRVHRAGAVYVV
jgi:hypothetical protein